MNAETICSIIFSALALIVSIIGLIFSYYERKKLKRIEPTISIWDNKEDDIQTRISKGQCRVYISDSEIEKLEKERYAYVCIFNYFEHKMIDCEITILKGKQKWNVGMMLPNKYVVIPVAINGIDVFDCTIKYRTEENEFMKYTMIIDFPNMIERKDTVFIKRLCGYKKISNHNNYLSKAISSDELLSRASRLNLH